MELLSPKDACRRLGVGRTTLWRMSKDDASFPRLITLTVGRKAFVASEIDDWISKRIAARDSQVAA